MSKEQNIPRLSFYIINDDTKGVNDVIFGGKKIKIGELKYLVKLMRKNNVDAVILIKSCPKINPFPANPCKDNCRLQCLPNTVRSYLKWYFLEDKNNQRILFGTWHPEEELQELIRRLNCVPQ